MAQFNATIGEDKRHWQERKNEYLEKEARGEPDEDFLTYLEKLFVKKGDG